jgi:hypothetical protein
MYGNGCPGVEGERRQHRPDVCLEEAGEIGRHGRRVVVGLEEVDALGCEQRAQLVFPAALHVVEHQARAPANGHELLLGVQAVGGDVFEAGAVLLEKRRDPHHEELVEVAADDGEELDALEQRVRRVEGLVEHALVELEPAQLAVDEQRGVGQLDGRRRRLRGVDAVGVGFAGEGTGRAIAGS